MSLSRRIFVNLNEPFSNRTSAYVHIAAVACEQLAEEITFPNEKLSGGIFTTFLLEILKSSPTAIDGLSYKALIGKVSERSDNCYCFCIGL